MLEHTGRPRAAIFNSRQSKTPLGIDEWVRRTVSAAQWARSELGADIVSSVEPMTWDLATWAGGQAGAVVHVFVPVRGHDAAAISTNYGIPDTRVLIHHVDTQASRVRKSWWPDRDRAIVDFADVLIPVSVRPGGGLEGLLANCTGRKDIVTQFRTPYAPAAHHDRELLDHRLLNPELKNWPKGYLIHWTRACHGPWPGETLSNFFADLVSSTTTYCRAALDTLNRIVREQRIRASDWNIGSRTPVVSFTELSPMESLPLMRWRARWARWSFEPFGVAIPIEAAQRAGLRPVHYVEASRWKMLPPDDKPFSHSIGKDDAIWPAEREWRMAGSLNLDAFAPSDCTIIVRDDHCASSLQNTLGWPVLPMMIRQ